MYCRKSVWRTFLALAVIAGALFSWSGPGAFAAVPGVEPAGAVGQ